MSDAFATLHSAPSGNWRSPQISKKGPSANTLSGGIHNKYILLRPVVPATGLVGQLYGPGVIVAQGGRPYYTYTLLSGSLPPGLALNSSSGTITGTPTTVGTYNFVVRVVDSHAVTNNTATIQIQTGYGWDIALWDQASWA